MKYWLFIIENIFENPNCINFINYYIITSVYYLQNYINVNFSINLFWQLFHDIKTKIPWILVFLVSPLSIKEEYEIYLDKKNGAIFLQIIGENTLVQNKCSSVEVDCSRITPTTTYSIQHNNHIILTQMS